MKAIINFHSFIHSFFFGLLWTVHSFIPCLDLNRLTALIEESQKHI